MSSQPLFEKVLSAVLTTAAATIAIVLVVREVRQPANAELKPRYIDSWQMITRVGTRIGSPTAPLQLIEFTDIQCPYCRQFHSRYAAFSAANPDKVSLVILHFPLEIHSLARVGAHAIECANAAGRLMPFLDLAFELQDSLAAVGWTQIAVRAGITDTTTFDRCRTAGLGAEKIARALHLGDSLKITGTPTLVVNGWLFPSPPADSLLTRALASAESGRRFRP